MKKHRLRSGTKKYVTVTGDAYENIGLNPDMIVSIANVFADEKVSFMTSKEFKTSAINRRILHRIVKFISMIVEILVMSLVTFGAMYAISGSQEFAIKSGIVGFIIYMILFYDISHVKKLIEYHNMKKEL